MFILFLCVFCYSWSVLWPWRDCPQRKCPHAHLRPLSLHLSPTSRRWTGVQNCTESHAVGLLCLCGLVSVIMSKPCKSDFYQLWQQVEHFFHFVCVCVSSWQNLILGTFYNSYKSLSGVYMSVCGRILSAWWCRKHVTYSTEERAMEVGRPCSTPWITFIFNSLLGVSNNIFELWRYSGNQQGIGDFNEISTTAMWARLPHTYVEDKGCSVT